MTAYRVKRLTALARTNVGVNSGNAGFGESQTRSTEINSHLVIISVTALDATVAEEEGLDTQ
jgi:hypothetical protein